jgi:putative endonuclease
MTKSRKKLGAWGEGKAVEYLRLAGYKVHNKNVRTDYGEIDILASKDGIAVFVEVKTRRTQTFGLPEESITPGKMEKMLQSSQAYMLDHPELGDNWQIDVIAIQCGGTGNPKIIHFENVAYD